MCHLGALWTAALRGSMHEIMRWVNVKRLAAIDMHGTSGTSLRRRIILAEFTAGLVALGSFDPARGAVRPWLFGMAEVAFALGIPEGTVGSRLNRARRKIIAALGGPSDPASPSALTADGFPTTLWRS